MNNDFLEKMHNYLTNDEYIKFVDTLDAPAKHGFTLNYKKLRESTLNFAEIIDKWNLKKVYENDKYSYYVYDKNLLEKKGIFLGKHPLYHAGLYYIQEPSSNMVLRNIDIKSDYKIIDLCSAPGGKTIQALYHLDKNNGGVIYTNDIDFKRIKAVYSNIERMGFLNTAKIFNKPVEFFVEGYEKYFDIVILDAPCSGEGMMRKNDMSITQWSQKLVERCAKLQKELIDSAVKLVKSGGILSYSTCTYSKEEDEDNVQYIKEKYNDFELVEERKIYHFEGIGEGQFYATFKRK